jgi:hypothetical protein
MKEFTIAILVIFGVIVLTVISCLLSGWVLTILWGWFLVPFGLAQINLAHGIGICLAGRIISGSATRVEPHNASEDPFERMGRVMITVIVAPLTALLIGWIAQMFM